MFETIKDEELVTATGGLNLGSQGGPINGPTIFNPLGPRPDGSSPGTIVEGQIPGFPQIPQRPF